MYLFEMKVTNLNSDREVAQAAMIGDIADLKCKENVMEIMETIGKLVVEFNGEKRQVE